MWSLFVAYIFVQTAAHSYICVLLLAALFLEKGPFLVSFWRQNIGGATAYGKCMFRQNV